MNMEYKSFFNYLKEGVEKYLIWQPTGIFRAMVDYLDTLTSSNNEVYRGASDKEISILKNTKVFKSNGKGNTRDNAGTYVSADIHLAAAFALRYYRDGHGGSVLVLEKSKLPELVARDPGNFTVDHVPLEAVKRIINLKDFTGR